MKQLKKILQLFMALVMGMVLFISCDEIFPDDPDNPDKPGKLTKMTFIGTTGNNPCFITWEKGEQPTIEPIEGIKLESSDHPNKSGQAGKYMLVCSSRFDVRGEYYKKGSWRGGESVPYLIDLETLEWEYLPHVKGNNDLGFVPNIRAFFVSPDGKKACYSYQRVNAFADGQTYENRGEDGMAIYDFDSGKTEVIELGGLLNAVGFKGAENFGWFIYINCFTPDSKTIIGTINYNATYGGFAGWQGGSHKLFRYDIAKNEFDLIIGESEGSPSFRTILNDNETLYFWNVGYGFSFHFKYNLKSRKVTSLPEGFEGMPSLSMNNHIRLGNKGNLEAYFGGNYKKEVNGKVEGVKFKNLPENSLQFNKSRTKAYGLITTKERNYYVELQSVEADADAPVDTLFTLPPNVSNLMQIW